METGRYCSNNNIERTSSYPTYEEWKPNSNLLASISFISSYPTYEEWKQSFLNIKIFRFIPFLSYLWGMETSQLLACSEVSPSVLILPMRNGNTGEPVPTHIPGFAFLSYLWGMETCFVTHLPCLPCKRSYPTYEEWKQVKDKCWMEETRVLILPMRNGNHLLKTRTHIPYDLVLILPMRNGNSDLRDSGEIEQKFLSYLWGMETSDFFSSYLTLNCSYPTYEEWKQIDAWTKKRTRLDSSYPTYEEWKHLLLSVESFIIW